MPGTVLEAEGTVVSGADKTLPLWKCCKQAFYTACLLCICSDQQGHKSAKVERKSGIQCLPAILGERSGQLIVSRRLSKMNKQSPIYKVYQVLQDGSRETAQTISSCHN